MPRLSNGQSFDGTLAKSPAKIVCSREYEIYEIQLDIDDREQCLQAAEARATHLEERLKKCEADLLGAEYLLEREEADKIVIQNEEMVRTRELACAMQKIEELDDVRQRFVEFTYEFTSTMRIDASTVLHQASSGNPTPKARININESHVRGV